MMWMWRFFGGLLCQRGDGCGGEVGGCEEVGGVVAVGECFWQAEAVSRHRGVAEIGCYLLAEAAVEAVVFEGDDEAEVAQAVEGSCVEARHIAWVDYHGVEPLFGHKLCCFEAHAEE